MVTMSQTYRVLLKNHSLLKLFVRFRQNSVKSTLKEKEVEKLVRPNKKITSYLEDFRKDYIDIIDKIPISLLKICKKPDSIYLFNKKTAKSIVTILGKHIDKQSPIIEINPGFGFLTTEMLKSFNNSIYLYESSLEFKEEINEINKQHSQRLNIKYHDFYKLSRLAYCDNNKELMKILDNLATDENEGEVTVTLLKSTPNISMRNDRAITVVGALSSTTFLEYLLLTLLFHNSKCKLGKPDFYFLMLEKHFERLLFESVHTKNTNKNLLKCFDLFFDVKLLGKVPGKHYLPWFTSPKTLQNEEFDLHLVNIKFKDKLPLPPSYLPLLWFFFRKNTFSRNTRIIPMLEQWIPGCGVWFICDQRPPGVPAELMDDEKLPHINIFTRFGDLDLKQHLLILKRFISLPKFEESAFRSTMESVAPKHASIALEVKKHLADAEHEGDQDTDVENELDGEHEEE